jgi:hypothetical protein
MVGSRAVGWALVLLSLAAVVLIDKVGRGENVGGMAWERRIGECGEGEGGQEGNKGGEGEGEGLGMTRRSILEAVASCWAFPQEVLYSSRLRSVLTPFLLVCWCAEPRRQQRAAHDPAQHGAPRRGCPFSTRVESGHQQVCCPPNDPPREPPASVMASIISKVLDKVREPFNHSVQESFLCACRARVVMLTWAPNGNVLQRRPCRRAGVGSQGWIGR